MFAIIFILILSILYVYKRRKDKEGLPPGDDGWPFFGNVFMSYEELAKHIKMQRKKHGDIFRSQYGSRTVIYLADYAIIKNALAKPELSDRPNMMSYRILSLFEDYGVGFSNGLRWQNNRRFTIRHLKNFGMGKTRLESTVLLETHELIKYFDQSIDQPTTIDLGINVATVNIIWMLTAGRRYDVHDKEVQKLTNAQERMFHLMDGSFTPLDMYPILDTILPNVIKNKFMNIEELHNIQEEVTTFIKKLIDEHVENFDSSDPKDLIDMYLLEVQHEKDTKEETYMQDLNNLVANVWTLFAAGSDTTAITIKFLILYMAVYPDVQNKVHLELDRVIQEDRLPNMEDKINLPYLSAVILEIGRIISLVPGSVLHAANTDTTLHGYKIPKGAWISTCIEECHSDRKYFDHPDEFYPEHFLDSDGRPIYNKQGYIPFGNGKRVCLGESLAKMVLYLYAAGLLKNFEFCAIPGVKYDLTPHRTVMLNFPKPFEIIIKRRVH